MVTKQRLSPDERRQAILVAGVQEAEEIGFQRFSIVGVAERAACSRGLVHYHFDSIEALRKAVMLQAIRNKNLAIIAEGLATGDKQARLVKEPLRSRAARSIR